MHSHPRLNTAVVSAVFVAVILCFLIYLPGLKGSFIFDDWQTILHNPSIRISDVGWQSLVQAALGTSAGPLGRPLSMVTFALNHVATGLDPYWFKLTNVLVHLGVGISLFFLTRLLLRVANRLQVIHVEERRRLWIAVLTSVLWLLHPIQVSVALYVVQRMTSLAALFTVLALISYTKGRERQIDGEGGWAWILACFGLWLPAAVFSKESGLLIPAFCFVIEFTLLNFHTRTRLRTQALFSFYLLAAVAALAFLATYGKDWWTTSYQGRDYTLMERVLTEPRVLWFYVKLIVAPNLSELSLYHDDFGKSTGPFVPLTTLFALLGLVVVVVSSVLLRKRFPILGFAILFFLAGHLMESTIIALELVFEHRNYLPMYGILFGISYGIVTLPSHGILKNGRLGLALLLILLLGLLTLQRTSLWGDPAKQLEHMLHSHPDSSRANMWAADSFEQAIRDATPSKAAFYRNRAVRLYRRAAELQPSMCSAPLSILFIESRDKIGPSTNTIEDAERCLSEYPLQPGSVYMLHDLVVGILGSELHLPDLAVRDLFSAALGNPRSLLRQRAVVLSTLGAYLRDAAHDPQGAIETFAEAIEASPKHVSLWVQYAQMLAMAGQTGAASHALARAEALDNGGFASEIDSLRASLSQTEVLEPDYEPDHRGP